jgi:hypothetical protein
MKFVKCLQISHSAGFQTYVAEEAQLGSTISCTALLVANVWLVEIANPKIFSIKAR